MPDITQYERGMQHIGIPCRDIEVTAAFYARLGFQQKYRTPENGPAVCFLQLGNLTIETYEVESTADRAGAIDHLCIDVSDIDAVFEAAKEMGLKLCDEQVNALPFWKNGVRFFTVTGPDMERIEFCQIM
ncbi:MAG: VOC family protein [Lachnospiraceae bacterium]|jgi:lactoylglutathione lyase|nr:VOC family protein [Lachnospiraceae bacterium]